MACASRSGFAPSSSMAIRSSSSPIGSASPAQHRLHHLVKKLAVFGRELARLSKHPGEILLGILGVHVLANERPYRHSEVVGKSRDEGHRGILGTTLFELPDVSLRDADGISDLLQRLAPAEPQLAQLRP